MKKPVALISNDWHIQPDNVDSIKNLVQQKINLALENNISHLFVIGDIFQSRQKQPLSVLKCFEDILDLCQVNGLTLNAIPGNHDKTDYSSEYSFLDPFAHHPAFNLFTSYENFTLYDKVTLHLIPFFENDIWIKEFERAKLNIASDYINVLLSHIAVQGSVNNDGSEVSSPITWKMFKDFDFIYLGHYHNYQEVGGSVYHLPSIQQNNFGEDEFKGFTLVFDDGSFEVKVANFKRYETITIDLNKLNKKEFNKIIEQNAPNEHHSIRLKIKGSEDDIKSLNLENIKSLGFSIKAEQVDIIKSIEGAKLGEVVEFTDSSILEEFDKFCSGEGYDDKEVGLNYLKTILQ